VLTKTYNQDYQLDVLRLQEPVSGTNLIHRTHAYADGYNLTGITDSAVSGRNESYGYDPADRLATAQGPWGSLSYSYDVVGNRLTETLGATTGSYAYAAGSNRLAAVTQASPAAAFSRRSAAGAG
jgi:YD repeat-containing protein